MINVLECASSEVVSFKFSILYHSVSCFVFSDVTILMMGPMIELMSVINHLDVSPCPESSRHKPVVNDPDKSLFLE